MQAISKNTRNSGYARLMPGGRPSTAKRAPFGERLFQLREQKGISQKEMALRLGISQQAYAFWERKPTSLKPEQLVEIASILGADLEQLLGMTGKARAKSGPAGKLQRVLEEASQLPRHQQNKIAEVIEGMLMLHGSKAS